MRIPGYAIQRTIGKGGMATVYLATQESLQRPVALKTLRNETGDFADPEYTISGTNELALTERFLDEGRMVASIQHAHVVQIFDIGATEDLMYISMEYVAGGDLQSRLGKPIPPRVGLEILLNVGLALETAHRRGVIHRDVKPGNILFREDDTPLLSDFGIAKDLRQDNALTTTGHVLGSPFYIAPEQAESLDVDGHADLYSLGVIFYEMLTGTRPYEGTSAIKVILQHLQAPVPRLPIEFSGFQPLLDQLMAKAPEARFQSAAEMVTYANSLGSVFSGSSEAAGAGDTPRDQQLPAPGRVASEIVEGFRRGILEDIANDRLVLPSLPDVVLNVRRELEGGGSTGSSIARVIATDPALSAQVLRVANSAFYFGQAPVKDLQRAVVRLGSSVVQQVVMMLVVAQLYDVSARPKLRAHLTELWRHSTLVASLSEQIGQRTPFLNRDEAMLAGLIHDIGALPVLVWAEPIPNVMSNDESLLGITETLHADLGKAILEKWRYAEELIEVPAGHEDLDRNVAKADYTDVVQIANLLSLQGTSDRRADFPWWTLPAAARLGLTQQNGNALLGKSKEDAAALADVLSDG